MERAADKKPSESSTRTVTVANLRGLHARPCLAISKTVGGFQAKVSVNFDGQTANAASVLELLSLAVGPGEQLVLSAHGPQAEEALDALVRLFHEEFGVNYDD
jgi:phosphotransferase system HPr (HPr) family protein